MTYSKWLYKHYKTDQNLLPLRLLINAILTTIIMYSYKIIQSNDTFSLHSFVSLNIDNFMQNCLIRSKRRQR